MATRCSEYCVPHFRWRWIKKYSNRKVLNVLLSWLEEFLISGMNDPIQPNLCPFFFPFYFEYLSRTIITWTLSIPFHLSLWNGLSTDCPSDHTKCFATIAWQKTVFIYFPYGYRSRYRIPYGCGLLTCSITPTRCTDIKFVRLNFKCRNRASVYFVYIYEKFNSRISSHAHNISSQ